MLSLENNVFSFLESFGNIIKLIVESSRLQIVRNGCKLKVAELPVP